MKQSLLSDKILGCAAVAYLKDGKVKEGIEVFEKFKTIVENSSEKELKKECEIVTKEFISELKREADEFYNQKNYGSALMCYRWLIDVENPDKDVYRKCANCLEHIGRYDLEIEIAKKCIDIIKIKEHGYKQLGDAYRLNGNYKEAIESYEKYLTIFKSDADVYNYIGWLYERLYLQEGNTEYIKKSYNNFKKGYGIAPDNRTILSNLVITTGRARLKEESGIYWKKLLSMNPTHDEWFAYAAYCFNKGDLETAFNLYHHRYKKETNGMKYFVEKGERWDGSQDLSNSVLLVHYEQGYGDTFMFCRLLPEVAKLAKRVIFFSRKEMAQIIRESDLGVEVYDNSIDVNSIDYDYQVLLMDIPHILKLNKDNIPLTEGGYIKASKELVEKVKKEHFKGKNFKIGIMYEGSEKGVKERNIPIEKFKEIAGIENVELYSLQVNKPDSYFSKLPFKVVNLGKHFKSFADTAAAVENCDLIITTDNCILNLAGAMGKKTLAMFCAEPEYRWFDLKNGDVKWYKSVKPYCLNEPNKWEEILPLIAEDVKEIITKGGKDNLKGKTTKKKTTDKKKK